MKKIKVPFSLEEYNKGGYEVETEFIKKVRILCTNAEHGKLPIVALLSFSNGDGTEFYCENGQYCVNGTPSDKDLFLIKYEFEDGDVVSFEDSSTNQPCIGIFKSWYTNKDHNTLQVYIHVYDGKIVEPEPFWNCHKYVRISTEEEKRWLFDALATQKGLKWNAEIKDFESIEDEKDQSWELDIFGRHDNEYTGGYTCVGGCYDYCIPFDSETEHLHGTTEDCPSKYKAWKD